MYHRLVFGLCVGDLMVSFAFAVNAAAAPKEMKYLIPSARGNAETCTAQGLVLTVGSVMASFYNCMICLYYLSIITYNKNDDYIKRKLEPWFHGIPIVIAVAVGITGLIMKQYNNNGFGGPCYLVSYDPPHCQGVANGIIPEGFTVPCGRGDTESGKIFKGVVYLLPVTIVPAIIIGSMVTMYRTVRKIEHNMRNYGAGALRLRAQHRQAQVVDDPDAARERGNQTNISIFIKTLKSKLLSIFSCVCRHHITSRSNNAKSQKRAVLYMAMSYSLTWGLTWIPIYIHLFIFDHKASVVMAAVLQPLQGLYTLIVYMSPKVRNARNTKRGKLPWCQAIAKAWMSKGEEDRAILGRRSSIDGHRHSMTASMLQRFQNVWLSFMDRRKATDLPPLWLFRKQGFLVTLW